MSFLRCRCKNLRKILENTFWRTESKNITCCLLRTKIRGENRKSRNYDTICVKDLFRTIPEKLAGKKLWKKYHLYRNDKSICENNPKFIRRLVFEIFGFKVKFSMYLKICHIWIWRFWRNGTSFRRNKTVRNFWKSKLTTGIFLVIFGSGWGNVKNFTFWKSKNWAFPKSSKNRQIILTDFEELDRRTLCVDGPETRWRRKSKIPELSYHSCEEFIQGNTGKLHS